MAMSARVPFAALQSHHQHVVWLAAVHAGLTQAPCVAEPVRVVEYAIRHQQRCQRPNTGKRRHMLTSKRAGCEFGLHNLLDSLLLRFSYGILVLIQIIIADPSESIFEFRVRA